METKRRYKVLDPEKGLLEKTIFVDQTIYEDELEKIFGRAWLMIGHETQLPNPNDFFLTYMGEDPVILTRDGKGELHAFLNMCRHRGNRIVRADDGNAKNFMCAYHGWTFSNEGKLVSVPGLQEAYYGELDVENLGLVPVAHLDTYAGFVFATWAEDAPTLTEYLGDMRWYMDITFNRWDDGLELIGPDKWILPNNWKVSADNFVGDQYHAPLSHRSALLPMFKTKFILNYSNYKRPGFEVSPGNGHGAGIHWIKDDQEFEDLQSAMTMTKDWDTQMLPQIEKRIGFMRAKRMEMGNATVFPNMSFLSNGTVRVWHPRGVKSEVWAWCLLPKNAPDEVKRLKRLGCMATFGPSGSLEQDDMDNWRNTTESGYSNKGRHFPQAITMGLGHETNHQDVPGKIVPNLYSEICQRNFYARWEEMMNAEGWQDIRIDGTTIE